MFGQLNLIQINVKFHYFFNIFSFIIFKKNFISEIISLKIILFIIFNKIWMKLKMFLVLIKLENAVRKLLFH